MATALETLTSISRVTGSGDSTYYTVPAGKYAEIYIQEALFSDPGPEFLDVGDVRIHNGTNTSSKIVNVYGSGQVRNDGVNESMSSQPITLTTGQTVGTLNLNISTIFIVKEFNTPS